MFGQKETAQRLVNLQNQIDGLQTAAEIREKALKELMYDKKVRIQDALNKEQNRLRDLIEAKLEILPDLGLKLPTIDFGSPYYHGSKYFPQIEQITLKWWPSGNLGYHPENLVIEGRSVEDVIKQFKKYSKSTLRNLLKPVKIK